MADEEELLELARLADAPDRIHEQIDGVAVEERGLADAWEVDRQHIVAVLQLLNERSQHAHAEAEPVQQDKVRQLVSAAVVADVLVMVVDRLVFLLIKNKTFFRQCLAVLYCILCYVKWVTTFTNLIYKLVQCFQVNYFYPIFYFF